MKRNSGVAKERREWAKGERKEWARERDREREEEKNGQNVREIGRKDQAKEETKEYKGGNI